MTTHPICISRTGEAVRCTYLSALWLATVSELFQGLRSHDMAMAAPLTDV